MRGLLQEFTIQYSTSNEFVSLETQLLQVGFLKRIFSGEEFVNVFQASITDLIAIQRQSSNSSSWESFKQCTTALSVTRAGKRNIRSSHGQQLLLTSFPMVLEAKFSTFNVWLAAKPSQNATIPSIPIPFEAKFTYSRMSFSASTRPHISAPSRPM